MKEVIKKLETLNSKEDFVNFMELLLEDFKNSPGNWENKTLISYLRAIASWTEDMDGYYINNNLPIPENVNWKVFANILMGATVYE